MTAGAAGTYTDDDVTVDGLNAPGQALVHFAGANLSIAKTAAPTPAVPGTDETFAVTVTNNGPDAAQNVRVTDPLTPAVGFSSAGSGCSEATGTVTCMLGSLDPDTSHTFDITGRVRSSADGCVPNTATVTSDTASTSANTSAAICVPVAPSADLSITKIASSTRLPAGGGQVDYTLTVHDAGPSDATGVQVSDPLAAGLKLLAADPSQGKCRTGKAGAVCTLGRVEAGGTEEVIVAAQASATAGRVANTATVSGDEPDANPANNEVSATMTVPPPPAHPIPPSEQRRPDLVITKRADNTFLAVGAPVTYTVEVTNHGPDAAPDVHVQDVLDAPATIDKVRTTAGNCTTGMPLRCSLGTLRAGDTATITVTARLWRAGCGQDNAASVTASGTDEDLSRMIAHAAVCVTPLTLGFTQTVSRYQTLTGGRLTYTLRVTNHSRYTARHLQVCDQLPTLLQYLGSKPKARAAHGRVCFSAAALPPGQSLRYQITARVAAGITDVTRVVNHATLRAADLVSKHANALVLVIPRPTAACPASASRHRARAAC